MGQKTRFWYLFICLFIYAIFIEVYTFSWTSHYYRICEIASVELKVLVYRTSIRCVCASNEGSGESMRMRRPTWALSARGCDMHQNLVCWFRWSREKWMYSPNFIGSTLIKMNVVDITVWSCNETPQCPMFFDPLEIMQPTTRHLNGRILHWLGRFGGIFVRPLLYWGV